MLKNAYQEITVEHGENIGVVGMQVLMNCKRNEVIIKQPKWVAKVIKSFRPLKGAPTPAQSNLMGDNEDSPLLDDQHEFMSLNSLLMYGAHNAYPEIQPTVIKLSKKYNKATELDIHKAKRVA
jgi:hypothetical protein